MGEVVDFHRAETRPVQLERFAHVGIVRGDDEPGDAPAAQDHAEAFLREVRLAQPEVVELEA